MTAVDYVLPLRWSDDAELDDLTAYLRELSAWAHVTVVDGSSTELFANHAAAWRSLVTHVPPAPLGFANGKVDGVTTGLRMARHEAVVIADDDVRYDRQGLERVVELLEFADVVGPQNVFDPLPWHAAWDTARSLLNRACGADYPGTFAIRRSTWQRMGGYDGDVLFENLELMRTVVAAGGSVLRPRGLYVTRRPATAARFWSQRVRQAYDDLAQPPRLAAELAVAPTIAVLGIRRRPLPLLAGALATVAVAEVGRRRDGGRARFPARTVWFAPLWVLERGACVWLAVATRVRHGGVAYGGRRLRVAAHSTGHVRRRVGYRSAVLAAMDAAARAEAGGLVGSVAEGLERRPAAPAQGDRASARVDRDPVGIDQAHRAAHDQRPVAVRRDGYG